MAQRRYTVWIDANGFTRLTLLNSSAGCAGVQAALAALSNADLLNYLDTALTVNPSPAPVSAQFQGVKDAAGLVYQDAAGNLLNVQLPAPKASIFLADLETVDPAAIAALNTAVIGTLITGSGGLITAYVGGTRRPTTREQYQ